MSDEQEPTVVLTTNPGSIWEVSRDVIPLLSGKAGQILQHLGRDEPVFIFRAKDILSTMVIMHYLTLVTSYNPDNFLIESITETLNEFRRWQQENPSEVKLPD